MAQSRSPVLSQSVLPLSLCSRIQLLSSVRKRSFTNSRDWLLDPDGACSGLADDRKPSPVSPADRDRPPKMRSGSCLGQGVFIL